jgi:hypothetical protein
MEQIAQLIEIMHIGRRSHLAVGQAASGIDADMSLHAIGYLSWSDASPGHVAVACSWWSWVLR